LEYNIKSNIEEKFEEIKKPIEEKPVIEKSQPPKMPILKMNELKSKI
jgi:hypothetical protein